MIRVISASFYDENDYSMEFGKFHFWSLLQVQINQTWTGPLSFGPKKSWTKTVYQRINLDPLNY